MPCCEMARTGCWAENLTSFFLLPSSLPPILSLPSYHTPKRPVIHCPPLNCLALPTNRSLTNPTESKKAWWSSLFNYMWSKLISPISQLLGYSLLWRSPSHPYRYRLRSQRRYSWLQTSKQLEWFGILYQTTKSHCQNGSGRWVKEESRQKVVEEKEWRPPSNHGTPWALSRRRRCGWRLYCP